MKNFPNYLKANPLLKYSVLFILALIAFCLATDEPLGVAWCGFVLALLTGLSIGDFIRHKEDYQ